MRKISKLLAIVLSVVVVLAALPMWTIPASADPAVVNLWDVEGAPDQSGMEPYNEGFFSGEFTSGGNKNYVYGQKNDGTPVYSVSPYGWRGYGILANAGQRAGRYDYQSTPRVNYYHTGTAGFRVEFKFVTRAVSRQIQLEAGKSYTYSFWFKGFVKGFDIKALDQIYDYHVSDGDSVITYQTADITSNSSAFSDITGDTWEYVTVNFTMPEDKSVANFILAEGYGFDAGFDEFLLVESDPPCRHQCKTVWSTDSAQHWHECEKCGDRIYIANHTYTNACDIDCNICGYNRTAPHQFNVWSTDGSKHWHECELCGKKKDMGVHVFDNACDTTCNTCGYTRTITHQYKTEWSTDGTKHWHECEICGDKTDTSYHNFDNACDTTCNTCGYTRTITHQYKTVWSTDGSQHWHECKVCGDRIDIAEHVFSSVCDIDCNICSYVRAAPHQYNIWQNDAEQHWHECELCGETDIGDHKFDNACDTTCNICGYTRSITHQYKTVWSTDAAQHWHECEVCGDRTDVADHDFDNDCDTTCNTCGYVRNITHQYKTVWSTDGTQHWHECEVCGDKTDVSDHEFDNVCDTTCNICGYVRVAPHQYATVWSSDETCHWHECELCKNKADQAEHDFGDDNICDTCGYAAYTPGDLDGNSAVTDADAVYLLMNTFFPEYYPINQDCDFDGNGYITDADAVYLLMYTFFPDDYPLDNRS